MIFILILALLYSPLLSQPELAIEENSFFRFYFLPDNRYSVTLLMAKSEDYLKQLSSDLGFQPELPGKISVIILPDKGNIYIAGRKFPQMPSWVAGFADTERRIIVLRTTSTKKGLHQSIFDVFKHELSHILLKTYLAEAYSGLPWWFIEGLAMWQAKEWSLGDTFFLAESLVRGSFIPLSKVSQPMMRSRAEARQMYIEALSFFLYLRHKFGWETIKRILSRVREGGDFDESFYQLTHYRWEQVATVWQRGLNLKYKWLPIITSSSALWIFLSLLFIIGYARKKKRQREVLKKWEQEDFFC